MVRIIKRRLTKLAILPTIGAAAFATYKALDAWRTAWAKAAEEKLPEEDRRSSYPA
jgi:hypothetical protein